MHSLTASSPSLLSSHYSFVRLTSSLFPSVFFVVGSTTRRSTVQRFAALNLAAVRENGSLLGCYDSLRKGNYYKGLWGCSGFMRRCKDWDSEGDFSLEAEILEFMKNSKNPEAFPTKQELVDAGRMDLVDAIVKKGGWFVFGWDLDEEAREGVREIDIKDGVFLTGNDFVVKDGDSEIDVDESRAFGGASFSSSSSADFSQPAMLTGSSVEIEAEESGIEGILNRLEKERSNSLGLGFREKEDSITFQNNEDKDQWHHRTTTDAVAADPEKSSRPSLSSPTSSPLSGFQIKLDQHRSQLGSDGLGNSLKPEMWRSWIIQRTGFSDTDFEDAEIVPSEIKKGDVSNVLGNDILKIREFAGEPINREKGSGSLVGKANYNDIKSRIQQLESELSSVLHSLRFSADKVAIHTDEKSSSDDLLKLSDAWEFQENEIMNAQDRLRSIRAKLAVLEGKMALAIMDAPKIFEEKQKRIDNAQRALQVLKTTCVIWPNAASEVLLAGSFDGWSTQRKMEKSRTGIFSLCLQLYPGKYEIKFIVDGEWKIDPLRPIIYNNGYENNLLIIHD